MGQLIVARAFSTHPLKHAGAEMPGIVDVMKRESRGARAANLNIISGSAENVREWRGSSVGDKCLGMRIDHRFQASYTLLKGENICKDHQMKDRTWRTSHVG